MGAQEVVEYQEVLCSTCTCKYNHESLKQDHCVLEVEAQMNYYVILPSTEHQSGQRRLLPQDHTACQGASAKPEGSGTELARSTHTSHSQLSHSHHGPVH